MFQLTTPLAPAPGRAGSVGVPGAGGKGAVDLPDFMTFALAGVPFVPGNARQDPAGGGELVPGGTVLAPPAGHPIAGDGVQDPLALPVVTTPASSALDLPTETAAISTVPADATIPKSSIADTNDRNGKPKVQTAALGLGRPARPGAIDKKPLAESKADDATSAPATVTPTILAALSPVMPVSAAMPEAASLVATPSVTAASPTPAIPTSARLLPQMGASTNDAALPPANQRDAAEPMPATSAAAAPGSMEQARLTPVAGREMQSVFPTAPQHRGDGASVTLGTVAPVPVDVSSSVIAPALSTQPQSVSVLPAMPASVATFLASVGSRPAAVPLVDSAPKTNQRPAVNGSPAAILPINAKLTGPTPAVQSAGQVFAEAIHAAVGQGDRPRHAPGEEQVLASSGMTTASTAEATATGARTPLDMTQAHWPTKMIERIEVLRDAADAQDTRIKLIPDALGAIDVSMKRDGDTVHVHLAAERPETRAMIADAQPRLAELGEQRGLKIAASSAQTSGQAMPQDSQQQRGNPAPPQPARPASARAGDQPATNDDDDQRVA